MNDLQIVVEPLWYMKPWWLKGGQDAVNLEKRWSILMHQRMLMDRK